MEIVTYQFALELAHGHSRFIHELKVLDLLGREEVRFLGRRLSHACLGPCAFYR